MPVCFVPLSLSLSLSHHSNNFKMLLQKVMALLFEWDIQLKTYHKNYHRQQSLNNGSCPFAVCALSVWMVKSLLFATRCLALLCFALLVHFSILYHASYATYVCCIEIRQVLLFCQQSRHNCRLYYAMLSCAHTFSHRISNFINNVSLSLCVCMWFCSFI